ncbi:MAG: energy-coupling factor transporter transmembrane component T [Promethearchaeota archaeon]
MSLSLLQGFKFEVKSTPVHSLDPRAKMALVAAFSLLALFFSGVVPLTLLFLGLVPLVFLADVQGRWLNSLRGLGFFLALILVINTLVMSLAFAVAMIARVLVLTTAFSLFFLTVHPDDLALALVSLRVPYNFAFSMSLAFRFVPTLADEAQKILDAQQSRGLELRSGNVFSRTRNLIPVMIPLVVGSIRRALQVAESLDSRAFGAAASRNSLYELKFRVADWLVLVASCVLLAFGLYVWVVDPPWAYLTHYTIPL